MRESQRTVTSSEDTHHCVTEDEAQDSSRPTSERRAGSPPPSTASSTSGATSAPHTPRENSTTLLFDIVDADVPHATVMFSTDGVMIRYVVRFLNTYGVRWCVEKRYSDLLALHENLREAYESTRSLGTKISSFITSGSPSSPSSSPSVKQGGASMPNSSLSSSASSRVVDDNADCRKIFPKFPSKVLGKGTNQSLQLIMSRRRDMSHYFSELVRNNCRCFVRTRAAQKTLCDFVRPPPVVRGPGGGVTLNSIPGLVGAQTFQLNAVGSESAYYFREDGDGFLSIEQKSYTYAYFTVNHWSTPARGSSSQLATPKSKSPAAQSTGSGAATRQQTSKQQSKGGAATNPQIGPEDTPTFRAWLKLCLTRNHDAANLSPAVDNEVRIVPAGVEKPKDAVASPSQSPTSSPANSGRQLSKSSLLDRNGCTKALIPTVTICLPYARIVHDLYDTTRIVVALRCEKSEGRAEVIRRRDELVAFYRHVANGGVDRLPDVHEAKRFFVNFRRDNPLQQYGGMTVRLSNNCARTRDRLPTSPNSAPMRGSRTPSPKRKRGGSSRSSAASDTEGNVERLLNRSGATSVEQEGQAPEDFADDEVDENANKSLVISLASLRFSAAGPLESPTSLSAPGSFPGINLCPHDVGPAPDHTPPTSSTTPESSGTGMGEREACRNSSHVVGYVISNEHGTIVETRTKMVRNCTCSDVVFCGAQLASAQSMGSFTSASTLKDSDGTPLSSTLTMDTLMPPVLPQSPLHKKQYFSGFESSSGFRIHVFPPLTEKPRPSSPQKSDRGGTPPGGVSRKNQGRR